MMKIRYIFIGVLATFLGSVSLTSCGDYLDVNDNTNYPTSATMSTLLPSVCASTIAQFGIQGTLTGNMWIQFATQGNTTNQYNTLCNYTILDTDGYTRSVWRNAYSNTLQDNKTLIDMSEAKKAWNYWMVGKILMAYNFHMLTDLYGDIPFSQALQSDQYPNPTFDDSKTVVYPGIIKMLDEAIAKSGDATAAVVANPMSKVDLFCSGDLTKWLAFAKSLKLKMYLRNFEANKSQIASLLSGGGLLEDDLKINSFEDATNKGNPLYEFNIRQLNTTENMRACHTMLEYFLANGDHRCQALYEVIADAPKNATTDAQKYEGIPCGTKPETSVIPLTSSSRVKQAYSDPVYLMNAAECEFMIAEAYARLGDMTNAKTYYEKGVKAAFKRYSMDSNATELLAGNYAFDAKNALKNIMIQKWLSYAGANSMDGWFDRCRTGIPELAGGITVRVSDVYNQRTLTSGYVLGTLVDPGSNTLSERETPRRLPLPTDATLYNSNAKSFVKAINEPLWWQVAAKK